MLKNISDTKSRAWLFPSATTNLTKELHTTSTTRNSWSHSIFWSVQHCQAHANRSLSTQPKQTKQAKPSQPINPAAAGTKEACLQWHVSRVTQFCWISCQTSQEITSKTILKPDDRLPRYYQVDRFVSYLGLYVMKPLDEYPWLYVASSTNPSLR